MRKAIGLLSALLLATGLAWAQSQHLRLGDLARKVRAERTGRDMSKIPFFTNDTLPKGSGISVVGGAGSRPTGEGAGKEEAGEGGAAEGGGKAECDESCWRGKFQEQRQKIATAERELDVLKREFNLNRVQYYRDPNQAMREQYSNNPAGGRQLQELQNQINAKQTEIERLKTELGNMENEMRRQGGKPGWARP